MRYVQYNKTKTLSNFKLSIFIKRLKFMEGLPIKILNIYQERQRSSMNNEIFG